MLQSNRLWTRLVVCLTFALWTFLGGRVALADDQQPPHGNDGEQYETVVSASRNESSRFEAPRSIDVVTSEEMNETQAQTIPDAVERSGSVFVQRTNRGSGSPIIRGLIGPQNLILVDGVRFNTSTFRTGPNQYLTTFDRHALERVEVVRGPSSVLYGNGAMGGVVQLVTMDPSRDDRGWHQLASTSFSSADASTGGDLQISNSGDHLSALAGGSFSSCSNLKAGRDLLQPLSGYSTAGWRSRLVFRPENSPISVTGAYFGSIVSGAGRTDKLGQGDVRFYDNEDHLTYLSVAYRGNRVLKKIKATLSYHRMIEDVARHGCPTSEDGTVLDLPACVGLSPDHIERNRRYRDTVDSLGVDLGSTLGLFGNRLTLNTGLDLYQDLVGSSLTDARASEGMTYETAPRGNFSDSSRYRTIGLYLYGDLVLWDFGKGGTLRANGGVRFSNFAAFAPDVPGIGDVDYAYNGVVGSGGIQWARSDLFNVFASFSQGFRAPNLQETTVLGDTGSKFEIPNQNLKPERSNTIEVGSRLALAPVGLEATWFRSYLIDAIDEESASHQGQESVDGAPVVKRVNTNKGLFQGVEGALSLSIWRLTLRGGVAWIEGEFSDDEGTHPARRVPPLLGHASLKYAPKNKSHHLELLSRWALRQDRLHPSDRADLRICEDGPHSGIIDEHCDGTPGWYTLDLRAAVLPKENIRLDLAVENITDRRYKTHGSGFYAPGRSARLTATVGF